MDPQNSNAAGLLHFYQEEHPERMIDGKKAKVWKFLTEEQYEEKKDELPDVCFATHHYIKGLADSVQKVHEGTASDSEWVYKGLPDLAETPVEHSGAAEHTSKTTNSNVVIDSASPLYYSFTSMGGFNEKKVYATEKEALAGGQDWDVNPVVYYRVKKPVTSLENLPVLNMDTLYERQESEDSKIVFTIA